MDLAAQHGDAAMNEEDEAASAEIQTQVRVHVLVANPLQDRAAAEPECLGQGVGVPILIAAVFKAGRRTRAKGQKGDAGAPAAADSIAPAATCDAHPFSWPNRQRADEPVRHAYVDHDSEEGQAPGPGRGFLEFLFDSCHCGGIWDDRRDLPSNCCWLGFWDGRRALLNFWRCWSFWDDRLALLNGCRCEGLWDDRQVLPNICSRLGLWDDRLALLKICR